MVSTLQTLSKKNILAKHWIYNLIYPVFLMMMFVRAEREGEFGHHLYCCKKMLARYPKSKSELMRKLKVEESSRCIKREATVVDGGGLLYQVHWPSNGLVK